MQVKTTLMKKLNQGNWLVIGMSVLIAIIMATGINILYNFNDDTMIQSILSGGYTGTPDGHAIYILYPLGVFLAFLYRLIPGISWYGVFLIGSYALGIGFVTLRISSFFQKKRSRLIAVIISFAFFYGLLFRHIIILHYTIVAAFLGAVGLFYLISGNCQKNRGGLVLQKNIPTIFFLLLCFMVRANVFYLLLPFLLVCVLWKLLEEPRLISFDIIKKWCPFFLGLLIGFACLWGINQLAYNSTQWQEFKEYNEERTQLYDYSGIPQYEPCKAAFEKYGLEPIDGSMIASYDLILSKGITAAALKDLSIAAEKANYQETSARLIRSVKEYIVWNLQGEFAPYTIILIALYVLLMAFIIISRRRKYLWVIFIQGLGRSFIWIYLIYQGRFPERISDSLMIIEIFLLSGILIYFSFVTMDKITKNPGNSKYFLVLLTLMLLLIMGYNFSVQLTKTITLYHSLESFNAGYEKLTDYCKENPDKTLFFDSNSVYMGTEPVFYQKDYTFENYILAGGWTLQSPILNQKLQKLGFNTTESILKQCYDRDDVLIAFHEGTSADWLAEYLNKTGLNISTSGEKLTLTVADTIKYNGAIVYYLYKITEAE